MPNFSSQLKQLDFFSVTYSPPISEGLSYNHSSLVGGLTSVIVAILSSIYCIYYLFLWWNYMLLPKVTEDINSLNDGNNFGLIDNTIIVTANYQNGQSEINPFQQDQIVILPLILNLDVGDWVPLVANMTEDKELEVNIQMGKDSQYIILFTKCKQDYLTSVDQKCATDEIIQQYFNQPGNILYATVQFTTVNPSTFQDQIDERTYPLFIHSNAEMCAQVLLHYQLNHYLIDKAFLFSTESEVRNHISDSLNFPSYGLKSYCDTYFMEDTYGAYWVTFQQQNKTVQIGYPQISEVFASIGSIITILFSVKYIITFINLSQMRKLILDDLMMQYYQQIKSFKIVKNLFGKVQSVKFFSKSIDVQSFLEFQQKIHQQMACKLNYQNQLYEISRLQFLIFSLLRRNQIEKVHKVGIKVPIETLNQGGSYKILNCTIRPSLNNLNPISERPLNLDNSAIDILQMSDATILTQHYRKQYQELEQEQKKTLRSPEIDLELFDQEQKNNLEEIDFFEVNKIWQQDQDLN